MAVRYSIHNTPTQHGRWVAEQGDKVDEHLANQYWAKRPFHEDAQGRLTTRGLKQQEKALDEYQNAMQNHVPTKRASDDSFSDLFERPIPAEEAQQYVSDLYKLASLDEDQLERVADDLRFAASGEVVKRAARIPRPLRDKVAAAAQAMRAALEPTPEQIALSEQQGQLHQTLAENQALRQQLEQSQGMIAETGQQAEQAQQQLEGMGQELQMAQQSGAEAQQAAQDAMAQAQMAQTEGQVHAQNAAQQADGKMRLAIRIQQMRQGLADMAAQDPVSEEGEQADPIQTQTQQMGGTPEELAMQEQAAAEQGGAPAGGAAGAAPAQPKPKQPSSAAGGAAQKTSSWDLIRALADESDKLAGGQQRRIARNIARKAREAAPGFPTSGDVANAVKHKAKSTQHRPTVVHHAVHEPARGAAGRVGSRNASNFKVEVKPPAAKGKELPNHTRRNLAIAGGTVGVGGAAYGAHRLTSDDKPRKRKHASAPAPATGVKRLGQLLTGSHARELEGAATTANTAYAGAKTPGFFRRNFTSKGRQEVKAMGENKAKAKAMTSAAGAERKAVRKARIGTGLGIGAAGTGAAYLGTRGNQQKLSSWELLALEAQKQAATFTVRANNRLPAIEAQPVPQRPTVALPPASQGPVGHAATAASEGVHTPQVVKNQIKLRTPTDAPLQSVAKAPRPRAVGLSTSGKLMAGGLAAGALGLGYMATRGSGRERGKAASWGSMKVAAADDEEHPSRASGRNKATLAGIIPGAALGAGAAAYTGQSGKVIAGMGAGGALLGAVHGRLRHDAGEARKDIAVHRALDKERASREMKAQEKFASAADLTDHAIDTLYGL